MSHDALAEALGDASAEEHNSSTGSFADARPNEAADIRVDVVAALARVLETGSLCNSGTMPSVVSHQGDEAGLCGFQEQGCFFKAMMN